MFNLDNNKIIKTDLPIITHNRVNILEEDLPILFYGNNRYGNIILGSIINEDISNNDYFFFHLIIDIETFYNYLNKKISYYQILENSDTIFIIKQKYNGDIGDIYAYSFNCIPQEYLPFRDTFCPDYEPYKLNNVINVQINIADLYKKLSSVGSKLQEEYS
ncbi:MAG: hypothetical protein QG635_1381 [Bacteroidota bacterium]|nr:hypothetical protein [Bacteroidota bacterium]